MTVLFLSVGGLKSIEAHDQYPDLLREFQRNGYDVYVVCSNEKRSGLPTVLVEDKGTKILHVRIGNITQSGMIEKGIATLTIGYQYRAAIKKYFDAVKFDVILYTTPPITLASVVKTLKNRDKAYTYLMLKDIFPQNAVDIGILSTKGIKRILYKYFRMQEKRLYLNSDKIGTMSQANSEYLKKNNPEIPENKIEICPNCIEPKPVVVSAAKKKEMRKKYGVPCDKRVFVYGGNLGKPQDIPFIINCIKESARVKNAYFWIIGNGTEYTRLKEFENNAKPSNFKLSSRLPKEDYDLLIASCDVGLVFLDHRFTIPNFPSRMLSYMQAGLPVMACTDPNTDIGKCIVENGFGWWCESNDESKFADLIEQIVTMDLEQYSIEARAHLEDYSASKCFEIISANLNEK